MEHKFWDSTSKSTRKLCYRKDDLAMRPMYECRENYMQAQLSSRRLRKNLHITILSLFGGEIIFEVFHPMGSRHLTVTYRSKRYRQTDEHYCGIIVLREASHGKHHIAHVAAASVQNAEIVLQYDRYVPVSL